MLSYLFFYLAYSCLFFYTTTYWVPGSIPGSDIFGPFGSWWICRLRHPMNSKVNNRLINNHFVMQHKNIVSYNIRICLLLLLIRISISFGLNDKYHNTSDIYVQCHVFRFYRHGLALGLHRRHSRSSKGVGVFNVGQFHFIHHERLLA